MTTAQNIIKTKVGMAGVDSSALVERVAGQKETGLNVIGSAGGESRT